LLQSGIVCPCPLRNTLSVFGMSTYRGKGRDSNNYYTIGKGVCAWGTDEQRRQIADEKYMKRSRVCPDAVKGDAPLSSVLTDPHVYRRGVYCWSSPRLFVPLPGRYHRLCIFLMDDAWYMSMKHQHGSGSFCGGPVEVSARIDAASPAHCRKSPTVRLTCLHRDTGDVRDYPFRRSMRDR
jgi:hypothetical protein